MRLALPLSPLDKYLLCSAIDQGESVLKNWFKWKKQGDFNHINTASYRLLPMVYQNLLQHHIKDELTNYLKGTYKRAWLENQLLFQQILPIEKAFEAHNIAYCWLGEAALSKGLYGIECIRPIAHIVFGVSKSDRSKACSILNKLNWERAKFFQIRNLVEQTAMFKNNNLSVQLKWNLPQPMQLERNSKVLDIASQFTYLLKTRSSYRTINQLVVLADLFRLTQLYPDHPHQKNRTIQYLNTLSSQVLSID